MIKKKERKKVYEKYDGHCAYCGKEIKYNEMQVDHCIPKRNFAFHIKNGWRIPMGLSHLTELDVDHIDNLMPSCRVCNNWKKTFDLELFKTELQSQVTRLNAYSPSYRIAKAYGLIDELPVKVVFYFERFQK